MERFCPSRCIPKRESAGDGHEFLRQYSRAIHARGGEEGRDNGCGILKGSENAPRYPDSILPSPSITERARKPAAATGAQKTLSGCECLLKRRWSERTSVHFSIPHARSDAKQERALGANSSGPGQTEPRKEGRVGGCPNVVVSITKIRRLAGQGLSTVQIGAQLD